MELNHVLLIIRLRSVSISAVCHPPQRLPVYRFRPSLRLDVLRAERPRSSYLLLGRRVRSDPGAPQLSGPIYFIYFVNYIFKYVELIDTFLLALRGKPIQFLHIYHHAATLIPLLVPAVGAVVHPVAADRDQPAGARHHVRLLHAACPRLSHLVEEVPHRLSDRPVRRRAQRVSRSDGDAHAGRFWTTSTETIYGCNGTFLGAYIGIGCHRIVPVSLYADVPRDLQREEARRALPSRLTARWERRRMVRRQMEKER